MKPFVMLLLTRFHLLILKPKFWRKKIEITDYFLQILEWRLSLARATEDNLKNEDDLKNEDELKSGDNLKNEDDLKNDFSSWRPRQKTTDFKPDMLSGVQTGNGIIHDRYHIRGIAHARTNRKDDILMQRWLGQIFTCILEWG